MTYLALARQWRPRTFDALLGQDMVSLALTNALTQQRLHHAYLFTGTRGVGKTSVARLFAKALNCERGISSSPCLTCDSCVSIEKGCFVDLLEVDGASKTRVEDTRDLLENVQYAPSCGRFKIYLIDEVHMLSQHSFNALLKTLEEPPAHVKFLFATTDPQKIPATILSRCLQFQLRPLSVALIQTHLAQILNHEKRDAEPEALTLIAQAANGSMRDALSLLEQVIACSAEKVTSAIVKSLLGYTQADYAPALLQALEARDATALFEMSEQIAAEGGHYPHVLERVLHEIYECAKFKHLPVQAPMRPVLPDWVDRIAPETLQLWYQIALKGSADLHLAPHPRVGFEMCLLRLLAFQPAPAIHSVHVSKLNTSPAQVDKRAVKTQSVMPPEPAPTVSPVHTQQETSWGSLIAKLKLTGMALLAAEQAELEGQTEHTVMLKVVPAHQSLFTPNVLKQIEAALSQHHHQPMKVKLTAAAATTSSPAQVKKQQQAQVHDEAAQALSTDPLFQSLQKEFDAEVLPDSIEPV